MKTAVRICVLALVACLFASPALFADSVQDSVNATATPSGIWGANNVGWLYTPAANYNLTEILTVFGTAVGDSPVTEAVYSGVPSSGGTLLASSAPFTPTGGSFSGASISPLSLVAGQSYFIAFENVANWGANITADAGAVSLGTLYFDFSSIPAFDSTETGDFTNQPILEFVGNTGVAPEPASLFLLGSGIIALAGLKKRRQATAQA